MQRFVVKLLIYNELSILYFADYAMMSCFFTVFTESFCSIRVSNITFELL